MKHPLAAIFGGVLAVGSLSLALGTDARDAYALLAIPGGLAVLWGFGLFGGKRG